MNSFLVIIPAFGSRLYIKNTLYSIGIAASKSSNCKVHVHIQDAGKDNASLFSQEYLSKEFNFHPIGKSDLLSSGKVGYHTVSSANQPDTGMYDGLMKAFLTFRLGDFDWITWLGSDDTISETSFIRINQISHFYPKLKLILSSVGIKDENGRKIASGIRPCSQATIKAGLHNLHQLPPVQQEGSFIKSDLFRKVIRENPFAGFSVAGDWNLWRISAKYQVPVTVNGEPLGYFHKRKGQLSSNTLQYTSELFRNENELYLQAVWGAQHIIQDKCKVVRWENAVPKLIEWRMEEFLKEAYEKKYSISIKSNSKTWKKLQSWPELVNPSLVDVTDIAIVFNQYWQEPAKTEKHAKDIFINIGLKCKNALLIAFPWATFIDKLNCASPEKEDEILVILLDALSCIRGIVLESFVDREIISVCQHIHFKKAIRFFEELRINHVFWTHKVVDENNIRGIRIHAFPLYPVNSVSPENTNQDTLRSKNFLFSFIGAKANKWYLTDTRNLIFKYYEGRRDLLVTSRNKWHFQEHVYDQQVLKNSFDKKGAQTKAILGKESEQFTEALSQSAFSLCPSGSGPNSIRLWETLESNVVPVILADTYDPPGPYSLWQQSSLFIEENEESIRHLDDTLKDIDEVTFQKFATGIKQLTYDYGKSHFITDILRLIINIELGGLQTIDPSSDKRLSMKLSAPRNALIDSSLISRAAPFISNRGCELISSQIQTNAINADTQSKLEVPFANIFSSQPSSNTDGNKTKKSRTCKKPVKYFLAGKHSHRTPLSYCNFQTSLLAQGLERTLDIDKAHYIITGFSADLSDLINDYRFSSKPILVVSEEPLWDLTWSKSVSLSKINQELPFNNQCVKYHHLNHFNSDIFDFNLIPYFLLTDSRYISRYILSFQKILKLKSRELLEYWNALPQNTAFIHEKRLDSTHDYIFDEAKPIRLSKYRSELAMNIKTDDILREGKGWPTKLPSSNQSLRQEIPDWHLDKLSKLNKKFRYVSALENVHYSNYVTEKIFDAYASMSVPIYYAREDHYIHKLVKHASFLNLYGLSVDESARAIESYQMTIDLAERYMEDVRYMLKIFTRASNMTTECTRISESLRKVLDNIGN